MHNRGTVLCPAHSLGPSHGWLILLESKYRCLSESDSVGFVTLLAITTKHRSFSRYSYSKPVDRSFHSDFDFR